MSFLLDTCVISELTARRPARAVVEWVDAVEDGRLYLSAITIGEISRGIERLPDSARRRELRAWLEGELLSRFQGRILALDAPVMLTWGELTARLEAQGQALPAMDSLIAALALHHRLALVTRNEKDFAGTEVSLVNPWGEAGIRKP